MQASEGVIEILKDWNINHIYGYPGDSVNNLVESIRKAGEAIQFIQVRHEEVAALSASAEAKITGDVGVCLSIGGPGAIHLLNGMYDAKKDSAPMVVITGQISHDLLGTDNFQEVTLERLFDDVAIFNRRVTSGNQLQPLLKQAFREAYNQKGVAVLSVPDDVFLETIKQEPLRSTIVPDVNMTPGKKNIDNAISNIQQAKKPVILAGKGALDARDELVAFADKIAAPVVVSLRGKGVLPDEHRLNLGNLGQIGTKPAYEAMAETDLLILAGTSFPYREFLPNHASSIQIDINPDKLGKWYPVNVGLAGTVKETLPHLSEQLEDQENRQFLEACQENMKNWWKHIDRLVNADNEQLLGAHVINGLHDFIDDDAILSVDVGNITTWTTRFLRLTNQQFVISSWLATMGCGLPGAIAAKLTAPDEQVVAICGDGGFSMVMHDFMTAVKYQLPITVIVLNNEKIGMIKYEQEEMGNIPYETDLQPFNYANFANISGGKGFKVKNEKELSSALQSAKESNVPVIVDAEIEDSAPLPGKIEWNQAVQYSKHLWKKLIEKDGEFDMPPLKTVLKRLF
ncbi:pyruvate oxidase [Lentibacillus jeotgali]|uniref:pyruvate oxidase n=1 Tax=Lentibacillus jeotgali TaxID=558169 RepID=UPI00026273F8|nr:pyruvate oxidase [Lentibacillus jeotgali]